jgi:hypothetical protein
MTTKRIIRHASHHQDEGVGGRISKISPSLVVWWSTR